MCAYKTEEWLQLQVKLKSLNTVRWGNTQELKIPKVPQAVRIVFLFFYPISETYLTFPKLEKN